MIDTTHAAPAEARPNRRVAAKVRTRLAVLDEARRQFRSKGYGAVTIRSIAKAIGKSTGSIFANFTDKADLWKAAMECDPPIDTGDGPIRAALPMLSALRGLIAIRPANWDDDEDPDQVAAWRAADTAIALATRTPCAPVEGSAR
ncbi:hypothetical protein KOAAANKH_00131 [Brevundimonas sp. NIBR10]|uniref:TetR/AcrR family transcriptional regulator n=1 Tax=Brevundimonas sp. NIBR10 TaxID=3015997 RepID=UPI0022F1B139|nr:helix-turn-helix domain-containing protein [Brevundimonas sp. NIBR10]WGM45270.1 hypothetical protein KOAAANKH_00131 [Brevundimonas sp. NIBR10]